MMNYKQAIIAFRKKFPKLTVTRCIDYDKEHYVVEALENVNVPNYNSPYYGVDKRTGKITGFIPAFDIEGFNEAVVKRTVYSI